MTEVPRSRFPFARLVTIFALVFGVSLGLCGAQFSIVALGATSNLQGLTNVLMVAGFVELGLMAVSGVALLITVIL